MSDEHPVLLNSAGKEMPTAKGFDWEKFRNILLAISAVATPVIVGWLGSEYARATKEREVQGKFVELAITILQKPPSDDQANLRTWATAMLDKYSGMPFSNSARSDLISKVSISAEGVEIDGTIIDSDTHKGIAGAFVNGISAIGGGFGTSSSQNGDFRIPAPPKGNYACDGLKSGVSSSDKKRETLMVVPPVVS